MADVSEEIIASIIRVVIRRPAPTTLHSAMSQKTAISVLLLYESSSVFTRVAYFEIANIPGELRNFVKPVGYQFMVSAS
jgi:hypothetical protein